MRHFLSSFVILISMAAAAMGQPAGPAAAPMAALLLPAGTASETVQITYFLYGQGAYGNWVRPEAKRTSYDIKSEYEGHRALGAKVIAYLPGCEIVALTITPTEGKQEIQLPCQPLAMIDFHGQITSFSTPKEPCDIGIAYQAFWAHPFFGIMDGWVTSFELDTVRPNDSGQFDVRLPDFYVQESFRDARFLFVLHEQKTGNLIGYLRPVLSGKRSPDLKVSRSYDPTVNFTLDIADK